MKHVENCNTFFYEWWFKEGFRYCNNIVKYFKEWNELPLSEQESIVNLFESYLGKYVVATHLLSSISTFHSYIICQPFIEWKCLDDCRKYETKTLQHLRVFFIQAVVLCFKKWYKIDVLWERRPLDRNNKFDMLVVYLQDFMRNKGSNIIIDSNGLPILIDVCQSKKQSYIIHNNIKFFYYILKHLVKITSLTIIISKRKLIDLLKYG